MSPRLVAGLQAVLAGILFSTGGAAVKSSSLDAWQVAGLRSAVAAAALMIAIPAACRWAGVAAAGGAPAPRWWRDSTRRRALLLTLGTGCCYCLTLVLFVHANKRTTAAETIFLQSTAPLFVLLLSPLLLGERTAPRQLLLVPLFGAGLVMAFFGGAEAGLSAPDPRTGNVFATLCGLAYGLTLMGLRAADRAPSGVRAPPCGSRAPLPARSDASTAGGRGPAAGTAEGGRPQAGAVRSPGIAAAACGNVFVCLACLPVMWPIRSLTAVDVAVVTGLGLFQVAFAYVLVTRAARVLQAPTLALLVLLEPALSPFWAMWLHGEQPHPLTWLGGAVIAVATVLLAFAARKEAP